MMSNLYINIRIGMYHFQVDFNWKVSVSKNEAHRGYPHGYFEIYQFFT